MNETVTTDTSLKVSRVIKAPRERVYRSFLDRNAKQMGRFVPDQVPGKPMRSEVHELDPRPGGRYSVSMIADHDAPNQGVYTAFGRYLELVPNERIVQSHAWENDESDAQRETKVTITFRDVPGGTEVTILHEGLDGIESVRGHAGGWTEALDNLARAFEAV